MAIVVVYTTAYCPYCIQAKKLLDQKEVNYTEINLEGKWDELAALKEKTGMRTVPQIFINHKLIGGFQELLALEKAGKPSTEIRSILERSEREIPPTLI